MNAGSSFCAFSVYLFLFKSLFEAEKTLPSLRMIKEKSLGFCGAHEGAHRSMVAAVVPVQVKLEQVPPKVLPLLLRPCRCRHRC
jgi:hypothetical protein